MSATPVSGLPDDDPVSVVTFASLPLEPLLDVEDVAPSTPLSVPFGFGMLESSSPEPQP